MSSACVLGMCVGHVCWACVLGVCVSVRVSVCLQAVVRVGVGKGISETSFNKGYDDWHK